MDVTFTEIHESQWILCLVQITFLMSISWFVGRVALHRFPDISASVGVVALTVSAGLIVLTWAGVPRPFELTAGANDQAVMSAEFESGPPFVEHQFSRDKSKSQHSVVVKQPCSQVQMDRTDQRRSRKKHVVLVSPSSHRYFAAAVNVVGRLRGRFSCRALIENHLLFGSG